MLIDVFVAGCLAVFFFSVSPSNSGKEPTRVKNADGHSNTDGMRRMTK